jgi:osmotically inducible protein OsmC
MAISTTSTANAVWSGNLTEGKGRVRLESGAAPEMNVSWAARTKREDATNTSPEELIAAAHAACFCMALSNGLNQKGHAPEQLEVTALCTFEVGDGARIKSMQLSVVGTVPGMSQEDFRTAASAAGEGCPVSKALKGNVDIKVDAKLKS